MTVLAADAFRNAMDSFLLMVAYLFFQVVVSGVIVALVGWTEQDRSRAHRAVMRFVWLMIFNASILLMRNVSTPEAATTHMLMRFTAAGILIIAGWSMILDLTSPLADSFRATRPDISRGMAKLLSIGAQSAALLVVGGVFITAF